MLTMQGVIKTLHTWPFLALGVNLSTANESGNYIDVADVTTSSCVSISNIVFVHVHIPCISVSLQICHSELSSQLPLGFPSVNECICLQ